LRTGEKATAYASLSTSKRAIESLVAALKGSDDVQNVAAKFRDFRRLLAKMQD
jgi:hypothetical protein